MGKLNTLKNAGKVAKELTQIQHSINNCPICKAHQEAIKNHVLRGHPQNET